VLRNTDPARPGGDRQIEARRNLACGRLDRRLDALRPAGEARHRGRDGERMPASINMPSRRNTPHLAGARPDLIACDQCNKQVAETDILSGAQREKRGNDRQSRPAMRRRMSFARFVPAGGRSAQRRDAGRAKLDIRRRPGRVAGESKPQRLPKLPHLRVKQPGQQAAECIEQQQPGLGVDLNRQRIEPGQPGRGVRQGRGGIKVLLRHCEARHSSRFRAMYERRICPQRTA
jgi:hypothetical protein